MCSCIDSRCIYVHSMCESCPQQISIHLNAVTQSICDGVMLSSAHIVLKGHIFKVFSLNICICTDGLISVVHIVFISSS